MTVSPWYQQAPPPYSCTRVRALNPAGVRSTASPPGAACTTTTWPPSSGRSVLLRRKRPEPAAPRRRRRRIRKLRLLALVGVLGVLAVTAFSYGLVLAVGGQLQGLDPFRQQRQEVDGYVYAADGHTILD